MPANFFKRANTVKPSKEHCAFIYNFLPTSVRLFEPVCLFKADAFKSSLRLDLISNPIKENSDNATSWHNPEQNVHLFYHW